MNTLLIFFAFPLATIIISAILQRFLRNPFIVAALIFAIFLIVTFAAFDETFLIATLAYTIIAFITALLVKLLFRHRNCDRDNDSNNSDNGNESDTEELCRELIRLLRNLTNENNINTGGAETNLSNLVSSSSDATMSNTTGRLNTVTYNYNYDRNRIRRY